MADQTLGESRVRASFNPSGNDNVDTIKKQSAALIDACETFKTSLVPEGATVDKEVIRLLALAQTAYEEAAMYAVKAVTSPSLQPEAEAPAEPLLGDGVPTGAKVGDTCTLPDGSGAGVVTLDESTNTLECQKAAA